MADVATLRRMTAEPESSAIYTDEVLTEILTSYSVCDGEGLMPDEDGWIPTYDVHAAAAQVWEEKAGALAVEFDFSADGASFARSQAHQQAMAQARYHRARRLARSNTLEAGERPVFKAEAHMSSSSTAWN